MVNKVTIIDDIHDPRLQNFQRINLRWPSNMNKDFFKDFHGNNFSENFKIFIIKDIPTNITFNKIYTKAVNVQSRIR